MDEQKYWRNIIAREIKAEHDRVKKYYSQRGINSGGISSEEQTRLNIFALCQTIVETYNADIPPVSAVPPKERKPRAKKEPEPVAEPVAETIAEPTETMKKPAKKTTPKKNIDPAPQQNEFGEMI